MRLILTPLYEEILQHINKHGLQERTLVTNMLRRSLLQNMLQLTQNINPFEQLKLSDASQLGDKRTLYSHLEQKYIHAAEIFRAKLVTLLGEDFLTIANDLQVNGVGILRHFLSDAQFQQLVSHYDQEMAKHSSKTQIEHWFLSLNTDQLHFLLNKNFNDNFFHPLLIALIAYQMGGPIHLVDIRAKDTGPTQTMVRDNGPHRDDSPYGNEWKINISWRKSTVCGPSSQPFLAVVGYHDLERTQASEHGANFKTSEDIRHNHFNHPLKTTIKPTVMMALDSKPVTVIFHASHVLHQRYRHKGTEAERSCCIFAFHRITAESRPYIKYAAQLQAPTLTQSILQCNPKRDDALYFISALNHEKKRIQDKLTEIKKNKKYVTAEEKALSPIDTLHWLASIDNVPSYEQSKPRLSQAELRLDLSQQDFTTKILNIMDVDKHYDLDCPIYPDRRELIRKQLRNQIREQDLTQMCSSSVAKKWLATLHKPQLSDFLPIEIIILETKRLANIISNDVRKQLLSDLAEALTRCKNTQEYRTTIIFIFWTLEELARFLGGKSEELLVITPFALGLLQSYVLVTCIDDYLFKPSAIH